MKKWLVRRNDNPNKLAIIQCNFAPKQEHWSVPEQEEADWLEIVEGEVKVNLNEKDRIAAERNQKQNENLWLKGRIKEYPPWPEVMEALIENAEGRPQKLNEIMQKRLAVRQKYPKP